MAAAYIGIGSNIDPEHNVRAAVRLLSESTRIINISTIYCTEPVGSPGSEPFYNGIIEIETDICPRELKFEVLRQIEQALGRTRSSDKYAPRTADLDIIVYGDAVISEPNLIIPDSEIAARAFIALPLFELAPDLILPGNGLKLADVVKTLRTDSMVPLTEFTRALREEIKYK